MSNFLRMSDPQISEEVRRIIPLTSSEGELLRMIHEKLGLPTSCIIIKVMPNIPMDEETLKLAATLKVSGATTMKTGQVALISLLIPPTRRSPQRTINV